VIIFFIKYSEVGVLSWQEQAKWANKWMPRLAMAASVLTLLVHGALAWRSDCPKGFERSGADIVAFALAAFAVIQYFADIDAGTARLSGKRMVPWSILHPFVFLPILAIIGTVLWGYGDLLAGLVMTGKGCR
jgi:hypothetical protein